MYEKDTDRSTYPDLTSDTLGTELSDDGSGAEIGGHGEVRDGGREEDHESELVEETFASRPLRSELAL